MSDPGEREKFLARWSRLKRAAEVEQREAPAPCAAPDGSGDRETASATAAPSPSGEAQGVDAPLPPLPALESLTADSDFTVFLRPGVPGAVRAQALARAWSLDPFIRDFKEMADYAWDWNTPGGAPGYGPMDAATDIARMLDRILPTPPPPRPSPPGPDAAPEVTIAAPVEPEAEPAPVRLGAAPPMPDMPAPDPIAAPAAIAERPAKHGGAVPT